VAWTYKIKQLQMEMTKQLDDFKNNDDIKVLILLYHFALFEKSHLYFLCLFMLQFAHEAAKGGLDLYRRELL
jgi:hypothetical protein